MAQAKTLTKQEMTRVLDYIRTRRFAPRNRAMMLLTHLAGLRIGEVACLRCPPCQYDLRHLPPVQLQSRR